MRVDGGWGVGVGGGETSIAGDGGQCACGVGGRVSQFRFKAKLSETQTVSLPFRETLGKKFRFVSLQKFCFVLLKNMFRF